MESAICNTFIINETTGTCTIGAYEKWKGYTDGPVVGTTYIDMGKIMPYAIEDE